MGAAAARHQGPMARDFPKAKGGGAGDQSLTVLSRILAGEKENGYGDRAVFGGLDRFLDHNSGELRSRLGDLRPYSPLTPPERRRWAEEIAGRLAELGIVPQTPPRRARPARPPATTRQPSEDPDSIENLKIAGGIAQHIPRLKKLGIHTVRDAIDHFPHRHNDFSRISRIRDLRHGEQQTIVATVEDCTETKRGGRSTSVQAVLVDGTGKARAIWFGQGFLAKVLRQGARVVISGKVKSLGGRHVFESPEYELLYDSGKLLHTGRLVPVYPTTEGLPQRTIRRIVNAALRAGLRKVTETLPPDLREREGLIGLPDAIRQIHYPDSEADLESARRRVAFEEMLLLQLAVLSRRRYWVEGSAQVPVGQAGRACTDSFLASLPFTLTRAQLRAMDEITQDLGRGRPMVRLLQGDVGSGKTVVAAAALLLAVDSGRQGAFMAPTEILAEQHYLTLCRLLARGRPDLGREGASARIELVSGRSVTVALLTGSTPQSVRRELLAEIASGDVDIVVGTHALIQESVEIPRLAVGVVDEQHRFGVMQRAALGRGEARPHLLVMSATPIPRSLSLTVYGDLDVSVLDELPPGRKPVKTRRVESDNRDTAYGFVISELKRGNQAFLVFPLVEASEKVQARAATVEYERLSADVFASYSVGLLHGRMKPLDREDVLQRFADRSIDVLVSTSVIEVGIDFPNATIMMIDGAERFGLAQLHQFRGRVGRGTEQSHCLLLSESRGSQAAERLKVLETITDGFRLAEEDLRMRGPGDYLGTRQSGLPEMKVASIMDTAMARKARREADRMLDSDPGLEQPGNEVLGGRLRVLLSESVTEGG